MEPLLSRFQAIFRLTEVQQCCALGKSALKCLDMLEIEHLARFFITDLVQQGLYTSKFLQNDLK